MIVIGTYQHYDSFIIYDPKTKKTTSLKDDFRGLIINTDSVKYDRECMVDFEDTTDKSSSYDGERFVDSKYNPRILTFTIFLTKESDGDLTFLKQRLGKKYLQMFKWEDDWETDEKYLMVKLNKGFESVTYYGKESEYQGEITLSFIAPYPYWRFKNEKQIIFNNLKPKDIKNIRSRGNVDTEPIIKITPSTTKVKLRWNDLEVELKDLTIGKEYTMDCVSQEFYCYDDKGIKVNCIKKYVSNSFYDYPQILIDINNSFTITEGSISSIKINPNSQII